MRINTNIMSLNTFNQLSKNENATSKTLQKLSSGYRINSAADDAAGLAISEKMKAQITGLDTASANAQDGISLVQTAEGNLSETQSILQRMRELAVQAANDTSTDADRKEIQKEITQLKSEIDRISTDSEFNSKKLLDGSISNNANITGTDNLILKSVTVSDANLAADTYSVTSISGAGALSVKIDTNTTGAVASDIALTNTTVIKGLELGNYTLKVTDASAPGTYDFALLNDDGVTVASASGVAITNTNATLKSADGTSVVFTVLKDSNIQAGEMKFNLRATYATAGSLAIKNSAGNTTYTSAANLTITDNDFEAGGLKFNMTTDIVLSSATAAKTDQITTTNNALTMHIGANEGQTMKVDVNKIDTKTLDVDNIDLTTQAGAEAAITKIENAIETVSSERSKLGAFQNRLEHTINNLTTASENLTSANSRIRDVDMAKEMTEYTKYSILEQAATAMLAQANQQPQNMLSLLK